MKKNRRYEKFKFHDFLVNFFSDKEDNEFAVVFLDDENYILSIERLPIYAINEQDFYPRELVRRILDNNAAKIVLAMHQGRHSNAENDVFLGREEPRFVRYVAQSLQFISTELVEFLTVRGNLVGKVLTPSAAYD